MQKNTKNAKSFNQKKQFARGDLIKKVLSYIYEWFDWLGREESGVGVGVLRDG